MVPPETSSLQAKYFSQLEPILEGDKRISAAWLEGSFGRGDADRYSDIDLHILLDPADATEFRENAEEWLSSIKPLVLFKWLFGDSMINALTIDGLRIDIWLHEGRTAEGVAAKVHLLHAQPGSFKLLDTPGEAEIVDKSVALDAKIREFWRCIALLPSVIGRDELIVTQMGLAVELRLLTDVLINGYNIEHDAGVKKLNAFLPDDSREAIERALSLNGLSRRSVALSHLRLAALMQEHGPTIATHHQFDYPDELASAVITHVATEFELVDMQALLIEAGIATSPEVR